jgi:hypothetical protein
MPPWLADTSILGCNENNPSKCPPYDYDLWGEIVVDYLDRLTRDGIYSDDLIVEVWNEPDVSFFLSDLSDDDIKKSVNYVLLYNSTFYYIKSKYFDLEIGGPSSSWISKFNLNNYFLNSSIVNFDFFSYHRYTSDLYSALYDDTNIAKSLCYNNGKSCDYLIIGEWNTYDSSQKNSSLNSSRYITNTAIGYVAVLNNWPSNVSMLLYQWSEAYKYSNTANYPEYPQKWNMVSEPGLDNEYTPAYNVTKNFAHFHAGGDTVVNSSSDNSNVKVVSSIKPNGTIYTTVIATANMSSVSVNYKNTNVYGLKNIESGALHIASNGIINLGSFSQYDVKYYVEIDAPPAGDTLAPTVVISSPKSQDYSSYNIFVNVSINEFGYCTYSLDNGKTNRSLSSSNALKFVSTYTAPAQGDYILRADCMDMSGNRAYSVIGFSVNIPSSNTGSGSSGSGTGVISVNETGATNVTNKDTSSGGSSGGGSSGGGYEVESYDEAMDVMAGGNDGISEEDDSELNESDSPIKPSRGILGRVIDGVEDISSEGLGFSVLILFATTLVLVSILLILGSIKSAAKNKKKFSMVKEWIGKGHEMGYEHHHLKKKLMDYGWPEDFVDKAIEHHRDDLDRKKFSHGIGG